MRISPSALLGLLLPFSLATTTTGTTRTITLSVPASHLLPNPNTLPPSTHATLTTLNAAHSAPLTVANTFVFHNVSAGSYLADVHCSALAFAPLRIDVTAASDGADGQHTLLDLRAWETYRGNDWDNKGEEVREAAIGVLAVKAVGPKVYFVERSSFSVMSILKNPMILMGLASMALFFGMPKLVENMDEETRAEYEENSKKNPMNALLGGGGQASANPMGNFDMASFLSGATKKDDGAGEGSAAKGGKKGKK